jgi:signal transduction histidine kinase
VVRLDRGSSNLPGRIVENVGHASEPVTPLSSITQRLAERGRAVGRIASRGLARQSRPTGAPPSAGDLTGSLDTERQLRDAQRALEASRDALRVLAEEQAALRRVATLVAHESSPLEVFAAVTEEAARVLDTESVGMLRFEPDGTATLVAQSDTPWPPPPLGTSFTVEGENVVAAVLRTGQATRLDDWTDTTGSVAEMARSLGIRSSVATPIVVEGRLWGTMIAVTSQSDPLPSDTESRIGEFTELVATAIANTEARAEIARLADEQAAVGRVATLVAEESPATDLFAKVAEEVASFLGHHIDAAILRYEADDTATVVAVWGEQPPAGIHLDAKLPVDGSGVSAKVFRERRPVRVDDYTATDGAIAEHAQEHGIRSAVGCPILVQGRLWGAMVVARYEAEPFAAGTERRVSQFTELLATAIANAAAHADVQRLADEQAALRRVATLAAEGAAPTEVFDAVSVEVAQLLGAAQVGLARYETEHEMSVLAMYGQDPALPRPGMRLPLEGDSVSARVRRTGRSARLNYAEEGRGTIAEIARRSNVNVSVGAPITVDGRLWGVIPASWEGQDLPPVDAEERLARFAELLDTAIGNADSRDQLTASRARVLTAADEARRRVVRDLHDGAQQRLVHTIVTLKLAQQALSEDTVRAEALLAETLEHAEQGNAELRELAHGILPSVLTRGGLRAGVDAVVSRLRLPVDVDVTSARLAPEIEASAYFIVAEALTNVVKHSQAARAEVTAAVDNGMLSVQVRDVGVGGADPDGSGLVGMADRVAALEGRLRIDSPRGGGTVVAAELPVR